MATTRTFVVVTYDDGRVDDVLLRPVALVAAERHFRGTVPPIEGTLWAAHYQLRIGAAFTDWLETVATVEETTAPPSLAGSVLPPPSSP